MKLVALLIATLVTFTSCHFFPFENSDEALEDVKDNKSDIAEFFDGVFSHFNLSSPSQINKCFDRVNSGLYFSLLQEMNQILQDTTARNSFQLHLELVKFAVLHYSLEQTHACIMMTEDFTDLLDALKIKDRNPSEFGKILYLHYQAHYIDLTEGFKPLIENLNTQSYNAAGDALGAVIEDLVQTVKKEGVAHLIFRGFGNGFAIALDLAEPDDSLQCYDNQSAGLFIEFLYKLVATVAEGNFKEVVVNSYKFVSGEGKEILSKIPDSVFKCDKESKDHQAVVERLGIDVSSQEFHDLMLKYMSDNRLHYYAICKSMKSAFDDYNLHHAGGLDAHFFKAIASTQ